MLNVRTQSVVGHDCLTGPLSQLIIGQDSPFSAHQRLKNGKLGYSQTHRLAMVGDLSTIRINY
jgi:hypothetical protein